MSTIFIVACSKKERLTGNLLISRSRSLSCSESLENPLSSFDEFEIFTRVEESWKREMESGAHSVQAPFQHQHPALFMAVKGSLGRSFVRTNWSRIRPITFNPLSSSLVTKCSQETDMSE